jgi:hypothetical protein
MPAPCMTPRPISNEQLRSINQEFRARRGEPGKSGASVDHKSVRVDAWFMVWARVLAMGFGALIERLLT